MAVKENALYFTTSFSASGKVYKTIVSLSTYQHKRRVLVSDPRMCRLSNVRRFQQVDLYCLERALLWDESLWKRADLDLAVVSVEL